MKNLKPKLTIIFILLIVFINVLLNYSYATEPITEINITEFTKPKPFQNIDKNLENIKFETENKYKVVEVKWNNWLADSNQTSNRFKLFDTYVLTFTLKANEGYEFDYDAITTVNGQKEDIILNFADDFKDKTTVYTSQICSLKYDLSSYGFVLMSFIGLIVIVIFSIFCIKMEKISNMKKKVSREKKNLSEEAKAKMDLILADIKEKTKKASYHISFIDVQDEIDIFESKLGGLPYWDCSKTYPCNKDGKKLVLLAQINFEKEQFDLDILPKQGILQFFIDTDDINGLMTADGYKVVYHENINKNITKEDIKKLEIKTSSNLDYSLEEYFPFEDEYLLSFTKTTDSVGSSKNIDSLIKEILKTRFNDDRQLDNIEEYFSTEEYDYLRTNTIAFGSKILGYPDFTQCDPTDCEENKTFNTLLLQLDSEGPIMWGDSGICNFFINDKDLVNKDFSNVLYNWDCY